MADRDVGRKNSTAPSIIGGHTRLPMLDGLRSLVILVLVIHFTDSVAMAPAAMAVFRVTQFMASIGLDVFFVLSGFLITSILLESRNAPRYFLNFYIRRVLRILPVYYGLLVVFLIVLPATVASFSDIRLTPAQQVPYWAFLVNVGTSLGWHMAPSTGHFWSLAVEEQFYLIWPAIVYFCSSKQLRRVCVGCIILTPVARIACAYWLPQTPAFHHLIRFDVLALGSLIAVGAQTGRPDLSTLRRRTLPMVLLAFVMTSIGFLIESRVAINAGISSLSASLGMVAFVVVLEQGPASQLGRLIGAWPLRRIGMYSYAIYLFHDPLADSFSRFGLLAMPQAGVLNALRYCVIMVPTCVVAGALSWHLYERPFLRLKNRFS